MGFRLSRRSLLKAAARLGVGAGLALLGIGNGESSRAQEESEEPYFRESATTLTLGNQYYEVDFDSRNGAITRIFDRRGGGVVSEGNADESLWGLLHTESQHWIGSGYFDHPRFRAEWDGDATLAMSWNVQSQDVEAVVTVDVTVGEEPYIDLTARIDHRRGHSPDQFSFLHNLLFTRDNIQHALLPYIGGVLLGRKFFSNGREFWNKYPSWAMMADFFWLETSHGALSAYTLYGTSRWWLAEVSLSRDQAGSIPRYWWRHWFQMALAPGQTEIMPTVRLLIGEGKGPALNSYRTHNGIDSYNSVADKVGDLYDAIVRSPISSQGIEAGTPQPWTAPVLLHPTVFQEQDWEYHNPDWWPPAERLGGPSAYRAVFGAAQRDGSLIMPYVNLTAGHEQSLTAGQLREDELSLDDIAVRNRQGDPVRQRHGYWTGTELLHPVEIVRLSPSHPWYVPRLEEIMAPNAEAGNDLVYFDQVGALPWVYDAQPTATSPLEWSRAWLTHMERFEPTGPVVEGIWDRLTASAVIGTYSALYFDVVASGEHWISDIETYYPVAAALFRDKTLQYAHNLEGITGWRWSAFEKKLETVDVFRWHLMMGQSLSIDSGPLRGSGEWGMVVSGWGAVVSDFSHFVLGPYADDLFESFEGSSHAVALSRFASHIVVANATTEPYIYEEHKISPRGVGFFARDNSVAGGVFQLYNGRTLTKGEHYLIEQRKPQGIIVRQPMGADTPVSVRALSSSGTDVEVIAFNRHHIPLTRTTASASRGELTFNYEGVAANAIDRRDFEVSVDLGSANREDGLREVVKPQGRSIVVEREGRSARQPRPPEEVHSPLFFAVDRQVVPASGGDAVLIVEFFDENREGEYLGVVYNSVESVDEQSWHGPMKDNGVWRTFSYRLPNAAFRGRQRHAHEVDFTLWIPRGVSIGKVTVTNPDELERRTVAYYTIHDPTQGEALTQGLHLRGWTDATQPIADLNLDGLSAIFAWDAEDERWQMYSPHVPPQSNTLDRLEQGRAYYVRVANGQTLHWPEAPYGGVGFLLQPGRNLVCWLGTPDKPLTDAIAPLRGMKAEPLVSIQIDGQTYDMEESRQATEPLAYGQALWVEIDAIGPTRWLQF